jgi:Family of unknown function (DUF5989)
MSAPLARVGQRASTIGELFAFIWERKLWWMIPIIAILVLLSIIIALAHTSAAAPWMYPL